MSPVPTKTIPLRIVHYDTCDLSGPLLHGVKLAPERSEGDNLRRVMSHSSYKYRIYYFIARLPKSAVTPIRGLSSPFLYREVSARV